jgi:uncharacterized protein
MANTENDLIAKVESFAKEFMSQFDGSHDFKHVQRVARLALHIAKSEMERNPGLTFNLELVHIAALMHDVNDRKYWTDGSESISAHLTRLGSDLELANAVEEIVSHVSFSKERDNPSSVTLVLQRHPELGILQDADRIDAVGAIGIGRLFTFGGAKGRDLDLSMKHLDARLLRSGDFMKTQTGECMIKERLARLEVFKDWWAGELDTFDS